MQKDVSKAGYVSPPYFTEYLADLFLSRVEVIGREVGCERGSE